MDNDYFIYFRAMFNLENQSMKKIIVLTVICILTLTTIDAQHFVSGSFSYSSTSGEVKFDSNSEDLPSTSSFELLPRYGYQLNDKWAIGAGIGYVSSKQTEIDDAGVKTSLKNNLIAFAPFARLTFAKFHKFNFIAEGQIAFGTGSNEYSEDGDVYADTDLSLFAIDIAPVIQFNISEKWALETTINLFSFGYTSQSESDDDYDVTQNSFNIGAGVDDLTTIGAISIGAIYKF